MADIILVLLIIFYTLYGLHIMKYDTSNYSYEDFNTLSLSLNISLQYHFRYVKNSLILIIDNFKSHKIGI